MRVSKNDTICGLAAPTARQLMRGYFDDRPVEVACDILGVSQDAARDKMRAFEAAGYVQRSGLAHTAGDEWWATTVCELRMILKNRSPAISITDENIRKLTERFEVVYAVGDGPEAIPSPVDTVAGG